VHGLAKSGVSFHHQQDAMHNVWQMGNSKFESTTRIMQQNMISDQGHAQQLFEISSLNGLLYMR
jgi:hypothetical protein